MGAKTAVIVAIAVGSCGLAAPAAQAVPSRDLYMVKNLQYTDGYYIGEFAALRKKGHKVVGATGAFSSEYVCVRGAVHNGKFHGQLYSDGEPWKSFTYGWKGSGATQRVKGTKSVSKADMITYGLSNPTALINDCVQNT
jgi:hypothetical protein